MRRAYKYRLYPNREQESILETTLEQLRLLYNFSLAERRNAWKNEHRNISYYDQQNALPDLKKRFPEYKNIHSQVLQDCLRRLDKAYDAFFRRVKEGGEPGYPRFKGKGRYHSFTYSQAGFKPCGNGKIRMSGIGDVNIVLHRPIPEDATIKTCTVSRNRANQWFVSLAAEVPNAVPVGDGQITGIDLGLSNLITLSSGEVTEPPRFLRKAEKRLKRIQRRHSRKVKGSSNRTKHRLILGKAHVKVANQRHDFLNKLSRSLVDAHKGLAFEDLNIRGMVKNRHLAKSILDASWGTLVRMTAHKAESAGKPFILVPPQYTSQDCSYCGHRVPKTLAERLHRCPHCGIQLDRDHNAAINIQLKATAGIAGSHAWGDMDLYGGDTLPPQVQSTNQEAPSMRAG